MRDGGTWGLGDRRYGKIRAGGLIMVFDFVRSLILYILFGFVTWPGFAVFFCIFCFCIFGSSLVSPLLGILQMRRAMKLC